MALFDTETASLRRVGGDHNKKSNNDQYPSLWINGLPLRESGWTKTICRRQEEKISKKNKGTPSKKENHLPSPKGGKKRSTMWPTGGKKARQRKRRDFASGKKKKLHQATEV